MTIERLSSLLKAHRQFHVGYESGVVEGLRRALARVADRPGHTWDHAKSTRGLLNRLQRFVTDERASREQELRHLGQQLSGWANFFRTHRASPANFDPFAVLRIQRREYMHSNVLAWLLNPAESHGLGVQFLNLVLAEAGLPECHPDLRWRCRVTREEVGESSRLDVFVLTPDCFLAIENKIDAEEGEEQTPRQFSDLFRRADGKPFAAAFLSLWGEAPKHEGFQSWKYERIRQLIAFLAPDDVRVATFMNDYVRLLENLLEGHVVGKFKGFGPETRFLLENRDDVTRLMEALEQARADLAHLLGSLQGDIAQEDWWDDETWTFSMGKGGQNSLFVWKHSWTRGDSYPCFGIDQFNLEALISDDPETEAASFVEISRVIRNEDTRARVAQVFQKLGRKFHSSSRYPYWSPIKLPGAHSDPAKVRQILLDEFQILSKVVPVIDQLMSKSSTQPK